MRFKVPGQSVSVRFFERVETVNNQYDIFDVGLEQEDGSIDSVVVGGSFSYAKSLARQADENAAAADDDIPDEFVCPITHEIMTDPVLCADTIT